MLVLARKVNEEIVIVIPPGEYKTETRIVVVNIELRSDKVRLGIDAPVQFPVHRREIMDMIDNDYNKGESSESDSPGDAETKPPQPACVHAWVYRTGGLNTASEFAGPHLRCRKCGEKRARD